MLKIKLGKRSEIKFTQRTPSGEAGEMLEAINKMKVEDALFVHAPKDPNERAMLLGRLRGRISNWRKNERVPLEIGVAVTEDDFFAIYHRVMKRKPGRPPLRAVDNGQEN